MRIKTNHGHRAGKTLHTSLGVITFDEKCIAEIKDADFPKWKVIYADIVDADSKEAQATKVAEKKVTGIVMDNGEVLSKIETSETESNADLEASESVEKSSKISKEELSELGMAALKDLALKVKGVDKTLINKMKKKSDVVDFLIEKM